MDLSDPSLGIQRLLYFFLFFFFSFYFLLFPFVLFKCFFSYFLFIITNLSLRILHFFNLQTFFQNSWTFPCHENFKFIDFFWHPITFSNSRTFWNRRTFLKSFNIAWNARKRWNYRIFFKIINIFWNPEQNFKFMNILVWYLNW